MIFRECEPNEMPEVVAIRQFDAEQVAFPIVIPLLVHGFHGWVFTPTHEQMADILTILMEHEPMTWVPMRFAEVNPE